MNGARGLLGALLTDAAALSALIACGRGNEGTVVAKVNQGVYAHACQAGGTLTGPVAVTKWERAPIRSAGGSSSATVMATLLSHA